MADVLSDLPVSVTPASKVVVGISGAGLPRSCFARPETEVEVSALVVDVLIDPAAVFTGALGIGLVPLAAKVTEGTLLVVLVSVAVSSGGTLSDVIVLLSSSVDSQSCDDELAHRL